MNFRFFQHPIFPLVCLIPLTQIVRDEYPISHYPMYSQPTSRELRYQYVAGPDGKPLPITIHTGITPSQVGKQYSKFKANLIRDEEKRSGRDLDDLEEIGGELERGIKETAGRRTLEFMKDRAQDRRRPLPPTIKLVEVALGFGEGHFTEREKVVAELSAGGAP
jgi:hypothetical protein